MLGRFQPESGIGTGDDECAAMAVLWSKWLGQSLVLCFEEVEERHCLFGVM